ncbi:MAG: ABC transporter permease [Firmicutes bacterium]|uniref:ABC transporter permease n=1 Tax=Candidatus Onthovivens merdipullorum TaxID=2840889 RepID=A0A9D9DHH2_9BACL|nr:ABC transporter permease [Candidatus Onthovivens merdipullorum]
MVKKIFAYSYIYLILLLMYVPILVLIAFSFTNSTYIGEWNGFSFQLYINLFQDKEILIALGNTLIIAFISSLVSTLIGTLGAIGAYYSKKRTRTLIENINQIPVVNSEIVIALSLTVMFVFLGNFIFKENIFSFWTLLIGHVVLSVPFVYLNVKPKLTQMDPSLYEAALDLGCAPSQALRKILIPQITPGIVSGFLISITLSLDDFIVTAFTRGPGLLSGEGNIETLSTLIQAKIKKGPIPVNMRPLTTIIFLVVLVAAILVTVVKNQSKKKVKVRKGRAA